MNDKAVLTCVELFLPFCTSITSLSTCAMVVMYSKISVETVKQIRRIRSSVMHFDVNACNSSRQISTYHNNEQSARGSVALEKSPANNIKCRSTIKVCFKGSITVLITLFHHKAMYIGDMDFFV